MNIRLYDFLKLKSYVYLIFKALKLKIKTIIKNKL